MLLCKTCKCTCIEMILLYTIDFVVETNMKMHYNLVNYHPSKGRHVMGRAKLLESKIRMKLGFEPWTSGYQLDPDFSVDPNDLALPLQ